MDRFTNGTERLRRVMENETQIPPGVEEWLCHMRDKDEFLRGLSIQYWNWLSKRLHPKTNRGETSGGNGNISRQIRWTAGWDMGNGRSTGGYGRILALFEETKCWKCKRQARNKCTICQKAKVLTKVMVIQISFSETLDRLTNNQLLRKPKQWHERP